MDALGLLQPYSTVLFLIHTIFHLHTLFIQYFQQSWRTILNHLISTGDEYTEIQSFVKELKKIPRHIAYCINSNETSINQTNNVKALAKLISWSWASGTSVVSLYDTEGQIRDNPTELEILLEKAIGKLDRGKRFSKLNIKFHNVCKDSKDLQGVEKLDTKNLLHIIVFSPEDGKDGIVDVVKQLAGVNESAELFRNDNQIMEEESEKSEAEVKGNKVDKGITEAMINGALDVSLEPNLLIIFGSSASTLGFLPWHIRLTEIHWLPTFPSFNFTDFASLLRCYSDCDQKVGK